MVEHLAHVEELIDSLRTARAGAANAAAALAEREMARQALKGEIVTEMTSRGVAVTPAEKAAGQDPRLVMFAKETIAIELAHAGLLGDAEALRFRVQLALLEAEDAMRNAEVAA